MGRANKNHWPVPVFRCFAAAILVLSIAQAEPAAHAQGAGTAPSIKLSFEPLVGGDYETGAVTLGQPAPAGGVTVQVTSSSKDAKIAPLTPASLNIPAGQTSVAFEIVSSPVKSPESVVIYACAPSPPPAFTCPSAPQGTLLSGAFLALAANGPASVSMMPATVNAGSSATGTVALKYPAPKTVLYYKNIANFAQPKQYVKTVQNGGAKVTLTSTSGVTVPASISVPQGASSSTFMASSSQSAASAPQPSSCVMGPSALTATITAQWEQQSASGTLQVLPSSTTKSRYTSKTIRIDPKTIVGVSHDAQVVVLEGSDCANGLAPGKVMFLKHYGVLKVGAVKKVPIDVTLLAHKQLGMLRHDKATAKPEDAVAVGVSSAALTDYINEGAVSFYQQQPQPATEPGGSNNPSNPWAVTAEPYDGQKGDSPWKYTTSGTASSYSFTAFKKNGGLSASVSGKGQVNGGYNFSAVIHSGKVQEATFTVPTDGTLDVDWMAQTTASGQGIGESRLRLPPLYSGLVDDSADDIPFLFQIYANVIFTPGFGEKAAAQGHFKITYKGDAGIDGSSPVNNSLDVTPDISSTTSSAKAPHGVVVAINAPKFAMSFSKDSFLWAVANRFPAPLDTKNADFADGLESQLGQMYASKHYITYKYPQPDDYFELPRAAYVQWVSSVSYAGSGLMGVGLMSSVPCQQYYQHYMASAGMDKDMLGSLSGTKPPDKAVEVFKKDGITAIPSIKGCYPKK